MASYIGIHRGKSPLPPASAESTIVDHKELPCPERSTPRLARCLHMSRPRTLTCHTGVHRCGLLRGHHVVVGHDVTGLSSCRRNSRSDRRENRQQQAVQHRNRKQETVEPDKAWPERLSLHHREAAMWLERLCKKKRRTYRKAIPAHTDKRDDWSLIIRQACWEL